jgi:hypothetical protein
MGVNKCGITVLLSNMKKIPYVLMFFCFALVGQAQHSKKPENTVEKKQTGRQFLCPMNNAKVLSRSLEENNSARNITFTSKDSTVYAVKDGMVVSDVLVEDINLVIVKKDDLFYSYSNLKTVAVKKGETIAADQVIGYAAPNLDGIIAVDFYLSDQKGTIALNKGDFKMRQNKNSIYFTPMLGQEPE